MGHSAGGYMGGLLCLDPTLLAKYNETAHTALRGVIGVQGIYDLNQLSVDFPSYKAWFLDFAFGTDLWRAENASPQNLTTSGPLPPWLFIHSPDDELVNLLQTTRFIDHLTSSSTNSNSSSSSSSGSRGSTCDAELCDAKLVTGVHFAGVNAIGTQADQITPLVLRFIQRLQ
eukprot:TRINITY_DN3054_c0_g1_i1.p1 TRINITY_DN3054_c0_g1~~TRINITY_DN3054_c0_g1_i1.p1  ORF type:complete len:172 (-),score=32.62 TRINITY_DN3054_c0_g1_i1:19-534(-)